MSKLIYPAVFHQEGDRFSVSFPDIASISADGKNFEQAYFNAEQTLLQAIHQSVTLPQPSDIYSIPNHINDLVVYIGVEVHCEETLVLNYNLDKQMKQPEWLDELESLYYIQ